MAGKPAPHLRKSTEVEEIGQHSWSQKTSKQATNKHKQESKPKLEWEVAVNFFSK